MMNDAVPHGSEPMPIDVRLMNALALILALIAGLASLGMLTRWALAQPLFGISRIVVQGDTAHHNALTLQAHVGSRIKGNFFTLDLAQARSAFEAVPWVRRATVQREFPDRLRVKLEEHRSTGFWGADSESRMVNTQGEVFEANAGEAEADELPRFVGNDGQSALLLAVYRQLVLAMKSHDTTIAQLSLSSQGAWTMQLDSGAAIEMGRGTPAEMMARLQDFLATHKQVLATYQRSGLDRIESADLRNGQGYAIRLAGVSTLAAPASEKK